MLTNRLIRGISRTVPRSLVSCFASAPVNAAASSEKWPPYNVCSLPFNIKPNENHIKLKEPHKRLSVLFLFDSRANSLIRQLSMEAAENARKNMDFDSFKPGDAIEVTGCPNCVSER